MSLIVPLRQNYACAGGGPVLTTVDRRIFTLRYFQDCMGCGFCKDSCCRFGVDIDLENAARLKAMPPDFHAHIGVPAAEWFTDDVRRDGEFPSGAHVRSRVRDGHCVFLERQGRGCKIHAYCLEKGIDYHHLKPMVSILFPLTFDHGLLHPSDELFDESLVCQGKGPTCYEGSRGELFHYFGPDLVAELDELRRIPA